MLLTRLERENKNMDKEKLKFYSIGRGSLNLNGKFYYGLDYTITDFMMDLEQQVKKQKEAINKIDNYINNYDVFKVFSFPLMKRWEEQQVKSSIDYEFKTSLIKDLKDILKEVSE